MNIGRNNVKSKTRLFLNAVAAATALTLCLSCGDNGTKPNTKPDPNLNKWYYDAAAGACAQWTTGTKPAAVAAWYDGKAACDAANPVTPADPDLNKWYHNATTKACAQWTAGAKPAAGTTYYIDKATCDAANPTAPTDPDLNKWYFDSTMAKCLQWTTGDKPIAGTIFYVDNATCDVSSPLPTDPDLNKWYYDAITRVCVQWMTGPKPSGTFYNDKLMCDIIYLDVEPPNDPDLNKWYYNAATETCVRWTLGIKPDVAVFYTDKTVCDADNLIVEPPVDPNLNQWYYNAATATCVQWVTGEKPTSVTAFYIDASTCAAANTETDPSAEYTLKVDIEPAEAGVLSLNVGPVNGKFKHGTVVTITITPIAGWEFASWAGEGIEPKYGNNSMTVTITEDKTITAYVLPPFEMVAVEGGTFRMGCTEEQGDDCTSDESPVHSVTLSGFQIGRFEVTQKQWAAVMGSNPSSFKDNNLMDDIDWPVDAISWLNIQEFLEKLNEKTGRTYRMPTESEWEYSARGGVNTRDYKYAGSNNIDEVAWYEENSVEQMHPVGSKAANELGIYDMSGNVWEWVYDRRGSYTEEAKTNPQGPLSGNLRRFRGGGWSIEARGCRVSDRYHDSSDANYAGLGFRIAL